MVVLHLLISQFSEADEIHKICNVIGSPDEQSWPQGLSLAEAMKYQFPQVNLHYILSSLVLPQVKNMCGPRMM